MSAIQDDGHRIVIAEGLAQDIIFDGFDWTETDPSEVKEFTDSFELVKPERGYWHADPKEDYYQGISVMAVIRRKSDGAMFGFTYWTPISKHGEAHVESNGDSFDLDYGDYVFQPVEAFTITGYKLKENN